MSLNDEQPTSRRAARMVERERAARGADSQTIADGTGEVPGAEESRLETTVERANAGSGAVVNNAIFENASWARPEEIRSWAPAAPASAPEPAFRPESMPVAAPAPVPTHDPQPATESTPIVRRRDLRARPADAPPVDLTGEIMLDRSAPAPAPAQASAPAPAPPAESLFVPLIEPTVESAVEPPVERSIESLFAAPAADAAPSWASAAAPTSAPVEAVEDSPKEQKAGRRAMRAMAEPDPIIDTATSTMPPRSGVPEAPAAESAAPWSAPDGHWSRQLADDPDEEPFESTFSRQVGSTSLATNALVIPTAQPLDLSGPLTATGEIMLTGSIKLPDALARTGATEHVDLSDRDDLDDLFDDGAAMEFSSDSQPIRAAAAVSGEHVLGSPIVSTVKPGRGNRVLTGLLITASALAVVVTGLIITAFALGIV
jgi:hypothetical protein